MPPTKTILDIGLSCVIVLMMVSVGMELEGHHFRHVAQRKGAVLLTLAAQAVILPALGIGLVHAMALAIAVAVTLLNRIDYTVFMVVFFLTEVPLLLGVVAVYLKWWAPRLPEISSERDDAV